MELSPLYYRVVQSLESHLSNVHDDLESKSNGGSTYRIPEHIKKVNPNAFEPWLISFGPYHHRDAHLLPLEKKKHLALNNFKRRCGLSTEDIVSELCVMLEDL